MLQAYNFFITLVDLVGKIKKLQVLKTTMFIL